MCHALLHDPKFFQLLLRIDEELAAEVHAGRCECGGVLHRANYPRKPRACLNEVRSDFELRFSFCCADCRKRNTSTSVRFLGRRVYLGLAVVLGSARHAGQNPAPPPAPDRRAGRGSAPTSRYCACDNRRSRS